MIYYFCYGLMIKIHESLFGFLVYSLILQFVSTNFFDTLGIISYVMAIIVTIYLVVGTTFVVRKLNKYDESGRKLWISNHMAPIVTRQGFINLDFRTQRCFKLRANY